MKKTAIILTGVAVVALLAATDAFSRGGGGGRGGGGRIGGGGGGARPSPSINRSPSMSRAVPAQRPAVSRPAGGAAQRPAGGAGQGIAANRPAQPAAGNRPSVGAGQGIAANRPAQTPANRPGAAGRPAGGFERPSQGQLNNFLNLPANAGPGKVAGSTPRPAQLPAEGKGGQTITGPRGGSISAGGIGDGRVGPGGGGIAAGVGGVKITGPGGNSYTKVAGGAAIRGPGGTTIAAGRGASFANGQFVGGRSWAAVNGNFSHWGCFTPGWYGRYPGAWWPGKWAVAATAWGAVAWATAGSYCGCVGEPVYYDYGENITYNDDTVYYGNQPVASTEQYYDQAAQIADSGQLPNNGDWLPLGVFAVITEPDQKSSDKVVQLAINKDGVIRGNLHDVLSDSVTLIGGSVDKKTQRVALKLAGNSSVVIETGLYNLTNDEVPVLVHFGTERQESRTLVRLQQPES